ncbi:GNAT family N-acetyltransferase [Alkaliphilus peptidifermentans]|uniref:Acetyltransferase (GNAT) family protein n=1 Tax=Alkaliphilus peptidifermentans DSM 18978 TaxID=1120976 RepID=A0A1G5E7U5_9FIRM|nr:GNAT family N-acetyltransferase [Alkaliphilus peptidifermentans]SCY22985.1 Acetyltransferase (GNAT) family protein [Alkaliphilus peptidifermentans DSM 18978]
MNINETHISLLSRAFEKDPMFDYLFSNKKSKDQSKILIRFIIKRNRLLDGLILTDHTKEPTYVAIVDRPRNLVSISTRAMVRLNIEMLLLMFQLPFHVLRFLTKYQKLSFRSAPNEPHYYLTMIGVDPSSQGKGIGKKVLREIHEIAESSQPSYPIALDTENQQNVAYYESFGYELKDTKIIDGLRVYCMTRPAEQNK